MKNVLISIKPKYVELIVSGKKTVEVRRTRPKCETPFKCYIYETQGRTETPFVDEEGHHIFKGRGKVIGEFVCDYITPFRPKALLGDSTIVKQSCVLLGELIEYAPNKPFPKDHLYGWHITDLVVYDEPRELRDFKPYNRTEGDCKFSHLGLAIPKCKDCRECYVKRPYQSWGYVEATEPRQTAD